MNIVICSLNSKYIHSSLAPWYLLAGIREYGSLGAKILEGTINQDCEDILKRIIELEPDMLGFSCYIWNIRKVYELLPEIKRLLPDCTVVLGGLEVSYNSSEVLRNHSEVDFVLCGEGEVPFAKLCETLIDARAADECKKHIGAEYLSADRRRTLYEYGIAMRGVTSEDDFTSPEAYLTEEIPCSPYGPEYFEALNGRIAYIETSRGCPYRCAFCLSGRCGTVRFFPMERVKTEILKLANSGTKTVKFVDRTFNADRTRAHRIWQYIIDKHRVGEIPDGICFHFEIAGDLLDSESFEILKSTPHGLIQFEVGLQSFNSRTLEYINRKTNTEKLCQNIRNLLALETIHVHIDLIAGLPYENLESFKRSFNKAYNLKPHALQLGFLKLLHGADMREDALRYPCTYMDNPPYEVAETPWMTIQDIKKLKGVEDALERMYGSGRFIRTVKYLEDTIMSENFTAFDFFDSFAGYLLKETKSTSTIGMSLDAYTTYLYNFLELFSQERNTLGIDIVTIRDMMVQDRLTTNASGKIPECLKVPDDMLRQAKIYLESNLEYRAGKGVRRAIAILYSTSQVIYVDYTGENAKYNPVTGAYSGRYISLAEIEEANK